MAYFDFCAEALNGFSAAWFPDTPALRCLSCEGPALSWSADCSLSLATTIADLDGANQRRSHHRETMGRPDDFRGVQAVKLSRMDKELRIRVLPAIADVSAAAWDTCANPSSNSLEQAYNP